MSLDDNTQAVIEKATFKRLVSVRNKWRFSLAITAFLAHAFFVGGVTFYRDWFAKTLFQDGTLTIGLFFTALVIITFVVLEFVYILVSNKTLDPMQANVANEVAQDD